MKESKISKGRIGVYLPDHPHSTNSGYILKSRFLIENKIGRILLSSEHVHHINGDKLDDRIENLEILTRSDHVKLHMMGRPVSLDREKIKDLRKQGLGYKKISKILKYNVNSVKSVIRRIERLT